MKKILVVVLALSLILTSSISTASACAMSTMAVAVSDGGGSSRNSNSTNQNASTGGVNQNVTVQGDGNAVNVKQVVVKPGESHTTYRTTVNNVTVVQVVEPIPEQPHPDYGKMKKTITIYGEAFIMMLTERLAKEGWTILWSVDTTKTHNWVVSVTFIKGNLRISGYKLMYYTSMHETYTVALSTAYHAGWKVADYPSSQIVFQGLTEEYAISNIIVWLHCFELNINTMTATCGCCTNCNCHGACHAGCGCGCSD
ncbi:hypothetical protein IKG31_03050 [Candidatus Saccharibacteria bacterium]|nr:hypothetical protein [Candidatus Saccharibacteria bacterium]